MQNNAQGQRKTGWPLAEVSLWRCTCPVQDSRGRINVLPRRAGREIVAAGSLPGVLND